MAEAFRAQACLPAVAWSRMTRPKGGTVASGRLLKMQRRPGLCPALPIYCIAANVAYREVCQKRVKNGKGFAKGLSPQTFYRFRNSTLLGQKPPFLA